MKACSWIVLSSNRPRTAPSQPCTLAPSKSRVTLRPMAPLQTLSPPRPWRSMTSLRPILPNSPSQWSTSETWPVVDATRPSRVVARLCGPPVCMSYLCSNYSPLNIAFIIATGKQRSLQVRPVWRWRNLSCNLARFASLLWPTSNTHEAPWPFYWPQSFPFCLCHVRDRTAKDGETGWKPPSAAQGHMPWAWEYVSRFSALTLLMVWCHSSVLDHW